MDFLWGLVIRKIVSSGNGSVPPFVSSCHLRSLYVISHLWILLKPKQVLKQQPLYFFFNCTLSTLSVLFKLLRLSAGKKLNPKSTTSPSHYSLFQDAVALGALQCCAQSIHTEISKIHSRAFPVRQQAQLQHLDSFWPQQNRALIVEIHLSWPNFF